jgi:hypothetical protein
MTVFFAAGELEAYTVSGPVTESTNSGTYDTACARCSIRPFTNTADYAESPVYTSATTSWTHFEVTTGNSAGTSGNTLITWYNSSATAVFRLQFTGSGVLQAQYWNGSAWTNIGSTTTLSVSVRYIIDLKIICGSSGSFELYLNQTLTLSGSASMGSVTNIARHRLQTPTSGGTGGGFSQIICADVSTVGWKLYLKPPTGNGANTAFTGTFADVDETSLNDADYIESVAANDVETYTGAAMTFASGAVKAVVVSARALNIATGPQNMQLALRRSSTNYFTADVAGIGTGFAPFLGIWETDPSTGAAWTSANAALAANEFGVKSTT